MKDGMTPANATVAEFEAAPDGALEVQLSRI
jgi:hypothetical protein